MSSSKMQSATSSTSSNGNGNENKIMVRRNDFHRIIKANMTQKSTPAAMNIRIILRNWRIRRSSSGAEKTPNMQPIIAKKTTIAIATICILNNFLPIIYTT